MPPKSEKVKEMRRKRDAKVRPHMEQYAPVWMIEELVDEKGDVLRFMTVFYHPRYGWVERRYRYDAYNDVLYYHGQTMISEAEGLAMEAHRPYIDAETINTVDSYGG